MPPRKYDTEEERREAKRAQNRRYEASERGRALKAARRAALSPAAKEVERQKQRDYDAKRAASKRAYAKARRAADPERVRAIARVSRGRDPEKARAKTREWKRQNPDKVAVSRRARGKAILEGDLTPAQWRQAKDDYGNLCAYCLRGDVALELDHVEPIARGGLHTLSNVAPACRSCNARKGARSLLSFLMVMSDGDAE